MSKTDKLKEEIGWLKVVFAILVAIDISLVGWLVQNYVDAPIFLQVVYSVAVVLTTGGVVWVSRTAYRKTTNWRNCDGVVSRRSLHGVHRWIGCGHGGRGETR